MRTRNLALATAGALITIPSPALAQDGPRDLRPAPLAGHDSAAEHMRKEGRELRRERRARAARRARRRARAEHRRREQGFAAMAIPAALQAIAACESGGNPRAIGGGGRYRGKYQFDHGTWAAVGGTGDPAAASEAEQDYRAALLYARAGASPWPVCG